MAKKRRIRQGFKKCVVAFLKRKTIKCPWGARKRMAQAISYCTKKSYCVKK